MDLYASGSTPKIEFIKTYSHAEICYCTAINWLNVNAIKIQDTECHDLTYLIGIEAPHPVYVVLRFRVINASSFHLA